MQIIQKVLDRVRRSRRTKVERLAQRRTDVDDVQRELARGLGNSGF
jgi:hypothetical protein